MRTTVLIDDDVLEAARSLARSENKSVGAVLSGLARKALAPSARSRRRRGFPVFAVSPKARPLTPGHVQRALEDD
jgi:hypothetical protein